MISERLYTDEQMARADQANWEYHQGPLGNGRANCFRIMEELREEMGEDAYEAMYADRENAYSAACEREDQRHEDQYR